MKDAQGRKAYRNEKRKEVGNSREWESTQKWGRRAGTEIVRNRGREGMQEELGHGELEDRQDDGSCS